MTSHLARLAQAGILSRNGAVLRATPRFLAHAEATAARLHGLGTVGVLHAALSSWDDVADVRGAAAFLADFLGERDQLGALRPVFPVLEGFGVAA
ncbi:MAG: hypothetical protein QOD77_612 [Thermoplasmata archaeon]|jgi:hypothetical protein|nr:hypothetical protein [Thermoplasmata archaeon]